LNRQEAITKKFYIIFVIIILLIIYIISALFLEGFFTRWVKSSPILITSNAKTKELQPLVKQNPLTNQLTVSIHTICALTDSYPSILTSDNWIAVPISWLIGANSISINYNEEHIDPTGLYWSSSNSIVLLKIPHLKSSLLPFKSSFNLKPYSLELPLYWKKLNDNKLIQVKNVEIYYQTPDYIQITLKNEYNTPGIFIQNRNLVGWTFGYGYDYGILWNGHNGEAITPSLKISVFLNSILSGTRAELFYKAVFSKNLSEYERLQLIILGFETKESLPPYSLPERLKINEIGKYFSSLLTFCVNHGYSRRLTETINLNTIKFFNNLSVIKALMDAYIEQKKYADAILFAEKINNNLNLDAETSTYLHGAVYNAYQAWIEDLLSNGSASGASAVIKYAEKQFTNDSLLELYKVGVFILEQKWEEADTLLTDIHPKYTGKEADLYAKYEEILAKHHASLGKIVLKFTPGIQTIPLTAVINGQTVQPFFFDTGASFVTIPRGTARQLGLKIDKNTKTHKVATAGAVIEAYQVNLEEITINGYSVKNITALIMDLPAHKGYGLLGLSFLNKFYIEMDNKKGIITLSPK